MNVFNSLENSKTYLFSDIDYEMILVFKSSLNLKLEELNLRILNLENTIMYSDNDYFIKDCQRQINYFDILSKKIKANIKVIDTAIENLKIWNKEAPLGKGLHNTLSQTSKKITGVKKLMLK